MISYLHDLKIAGVIMALGLCVGAVVAELQPQEKRPGLVIPMDKNEKIVAAIKAKMAQRITDATAPAAGMGSGNMMVYQVRGYKTPKAFCEARDLVYQLCNEFMEAGEK